MNVSYSNKSPTIVCLAKEQAQQQFVGKLTKNNNGSVKRKKKKGERDRERKRERETEMFQTSFRSILNKSY